MTEHSFDLAAALLDQAVERLDRRDYPITRILVHEFGDCILNANHTTHDTGHTVKMWAYDEHGILAAAQADAPHVGGTARAQIVTFRAGHASFSAQDTGEFVALGECAYALTPAIGSAEWDLAIGDDEHPQRFPSLDEALQHPRRPRTRRLNPPADASRPPHRNPRGAAGRLSTHHAPRRTPR